MKLPSNTVKVKSSDIQILDVYIGLLQRTITNEHFAAAKDICEDLAMFFQDTKASIAELIESEDKSKAELNRVVAACAELEEKVKPAKK